MFKKCVIPLIFCLFTAPIFSSEFPITVKDGLGRAVTIDKAPKRIVSTIPSNTEILYDLGLKNRVIAVTTHCAKTCGISGKVVLGGWSEPEIAERIARLKPDLVLAFGGLQAGLAKEMDKKNIKTFVFFAENCGEIFDQIRLIGKITGTSDKAEKIIKRCQNKINMIQERLKDIPPDKRLRCLRLMSTDAMVIGARSFQNDFIQKAGGVNIFADLNDYYPTVTLEEVKKRDPDMIIFNRDDEKGAIEWFMSQKGWKDLRAARVGRLMSISCDYICHPNTRIDKTIEMLAKRFYPDKFVRVVSINPSATEIVHALNADDNLIAVTKYCPFPELLAVKENIGTILDPDVEKIISLRPDIVIATVEGNRESTVNKLRNAGINVAVLDRVDNFNDIYERISMVGQLLGRKDDSGRLINSMKERLRGIEAKAAGKKPLKVFMQLGAKPLVTTNGSTIQNQLIELAGGENIAKNERIRYPRYAREAVIIGDPDAIFIVSMGKYGDNALKEWNEFRTLKAVKDGKVYIIDSNIICHIGPGMVDGAEEIARILHPEEF